MTPDKHVVTIGMIDNPKNPGYPTYWHARGYGLFAANPLGRSIFDPKQPAFNYTIAEGSDRDVSLSGDFVFTCRRRRGDEQGGGQLRGRVQVGGEGSRGCRQRKRPREGHRRRGGHSFKAIVKPGRITAGFAAIDQGAVKPAISLEPRFLGWLNMGPSKDWLLCQRFEMRNGQFKFLVTIN